MFVFFSFDEISFSFSAFVVFGECLDSILAYMRLKEHWIKRMLLSQVSLVMKCLVTGGVFHFVKSNFARFLYDPPDYQGYLRLAVMDTPKVLSYG